MRNSNCFWVELWEVQLQVLIILKSESFFCVGYIFWPAQDYSFRFRKKWGTFQWKCLRKYSKKSVQALNSTLPWLATILNLVELTINNSPLIRNIFFFANLSIFFEFNGLQHTNWMTFECCRITCFVFVLRKRQQLRWEFYLCFDLENYVDVLFVVSTNEKTTKLPIRKQKLKSYRLINILKQKYLKSNMKKICHAWSINFLMKKIKRWNSNWIFRNFHA